ncbi:MAG: class I SAM-dependent methyltransferase [Halobacteriales archaeon]
MKGREWYQEDTIAEAYDDKRFSGGGRLIDRREKRAVLDAVAPFEDERVLEVACGTGRFSVMLAERGADVTGIDISGAMLGQAREKARAAGVSDTVEFLRGDAARLPFPDDAFGVTFAVRFFHLADTPETFLSEMRRITRETILFDTFMARSARSIYNRLLPMGSRLYTSAEVHGLIEAAGLDLRDTTRDFIVPYGLYRQLPGAIAGPVRSLDNALLRTSLAHRLASVSYWSVDVSP